MIRALRKTSSRTGRFLGRALAWRAPDRQYAAVGWGLVAGAIWIAIGLPRDPGWLEVAVAGSISWPFWQRHAFKHAMTCCASVARKIAEQRGVGEVQRWRKPKSLS